VCLKPLLQVWKPRRKPHRSELPAVIWRAACGLLEMLV